MFCRRSAVDTQSHVCFYTSRALHCSRAKDIVITIFSLMFCFVNSMISLGWCALWLYWIATEIGLVVMMLTSNILKYRLDYNWLCTYVVGRSISHPREWWKKEGKRATHATWTGLSVGESRVYWARKTNPFLWLLCECTVKMHSLSNDNVRMKSRNVNNNSILFGQSVAPRHSPTP